jgi:hypothetical protein
MDSYLRMPFVEIEVRLGTFTGNKFDSSVDRKYFEHILYELESRGSWKNIIFQESVDYINDNNRLVNDSSLIMKENVLTNTIQVKNSPFDIRFSVNQEFELNSYKKSFNKKDSVVRNKKRKSFISDYFKYELSEVSQTINNITKVKYELEIELLVNKETLTWTSEYINDFLECKIYDLINIVEPMTRENFKIKLNK